MSRPTRDGTAELISRDQIFRCERGRGNIIFPYSADHDQDWQPYPVDPDSTTVLQHVITINTCKYILSQVKTAQEVNSSSIRQFRSRFFVDLRT